MKKPFTAVAVAVFSLVAIVQLVRLVAGWEVRIDGLTIPLWASGIAVVIAAVLALMVWKESR